MEENKGFSTNDRRASLKKDVGEIKEEPVEKSESQSCSAGDIPIDFSTFILSMSSSAFLHFGEIPHPETQEKIKNLPAAKQTVDIIDMLRVKTEGNLTEEEKRLVDNILFELRMKYMEAVKG